MIPSLLSMYLVFMFLAFFMIPLLFAPGATYSVSLAPSCDEVTFQVKVCCKPPKHVLLIIGDGPRREELVLILCTISTCGACALKVENTMNFANGLAHYCADHLVEPITA